MRAVTLLALALLAIGCDDQEMGGPCSPVGFTACSGNDQVTCTPDPAADGAGLTVLRDCTAEGLVCVSSGFDGACGNATLGGTCQVQNYLACADGEVARCVFVSEQPEPGLSGDIGVWRVQTMCSDSGQTCSDIGGGPSCVSP